MLLLKVVGMDCNHCVETVTRAAQAVPGVEGVAVDLASGDVRIAGDADPAALRQAIERAGYDVAA